MFANLLVREFLGSDRHVVSAQLGTTGNDTSQVILRDDAQGPNYLAAHVADTKSWLAARGLPEVLAVDAWQGNSQRDHLRQTQVVRDLVGQVVAGEQGNRGVMVESNFVAARQDLDPTSPGSLTYGQCVTDACVDLRTTEQLLAELAYAVRARRAH